jgi:hypothetical protein
VNLLEKNRIIKSPQRILKEQFLTSSKSKAILNFKNKLGIKNNRIAKEEKNKLNYISETIEYNVEQKNLYFPTCDELKTENKLKKLTNIKFAMSKNLPKQNNISISGILGLAYESRTNYLLNQMYLQGLISQRIMGLEMSIKEKNKGKLIIGEIDPIVLQNERNINWISVNTHSDHWTVDMDKAEIALVKSPNKQKVGLTVNPSLKLIFDSGSSFIYFNSEMYLELMSVLKSMDVSCFFDPSILEIECGYDSKLIFDLNLIIKVQNKELSIPFKSMFELIDDKEQSVFKSKILPIEQNMIILGLSFLKDYYTVFDLDHSQIGLIKAGNLKSYKINESNVNLLSSLGLYLLVIFGIGLAYQKNKKIFDETRRYQEL